MDYNQLLKKYFEGKCTDEELYVLYRNLQEGKLSDFDGLMNEIWEKLPDKLAMPEDKSEQVFKRIETEIEQRPAIPLYKKWAVYGIAASFVLILAAGVFFLNQEDVVEVTTAYQETKSVTLPDGTLINLNANSTLRYSEQLATQASQRLRVTNSVFPIIVSLLHVSCSHVLTLKVKVNSDGSPASCQCENGPLLHVRRSIWQLVGRI